MSVTIKLYKYESPNDYINKTLTNEKSYSGTFRDEVSVIDPVFEIETTDNLATWNYAYIEDLGRYYYITGIVAVTNKLWRIYCHVDVLMTYKPQILAHEAIISRQEKMWNLYLNDGESFKVQQNSMIIQKEFPNGFTGTSYVMLVSG